jgi:hypothetical protein
MSELTLILEESPDNQIDILLGQFVATPASVIQYANAAAASAASVNLSMTNAGVSATASAASASASAASATQSATSASNAAGSASAAADSAASAAASATLTTNPLKEVFNVGTGFTVGAASLTLTNDYGSIDNIDLYADGVPQLDSTLVGKTLGFPNGGIPAVSQIIVRGRRALAIGVPSDSTITDAKIAAASKLFNRINDFLDVRDYGAKGDGVTDDTAAINAAIAVASVKGGKVFFPAGTYKVTSPLLVNAIGVSLVGEGMQASRLVASGNFAALLQFASAALYSFMRDLSFDTTGTTTRCAFAQQNSTVIRFSQCYFVGDLNGDLCYSNGQNIDFDKCTWQLNSVDTWGINFDCFNQNPGVQDCRFGGVGQAIRTTNVFAPATRVEGLRIVDTYFINSGAFNIWLGNSFYSTIVGCVLDQSNTHALHLDNGATGVTVAGCYFGSSVSTGVNVWLEAQVSGVTLSTNYHGFGKYGVVANATVSNRVNGLTVQGSTFQLNGSGNCLLLDSVAKCNISGNTDLTATTSGSWNTQGTNASHGQYNFSNNAWGTVAPAIYDSASIYNFVNDSGIVGRKSGATSSGVATSSFTISHGCFAAPSRINAMPSGNAGNVWISGITSSQFTVNWSSGASGLTWYWEADCTH